MVCVTNHTKRLDLPITRCTGKPLQAWIELIFASDAYHLKIVLSLQLLKQQLDDDSVIFAFNNQHLWTPKDGAFLRTCTIGHQRTSSPT
jgi:hypothetical protein